MKIKENWLASTFDISILPHKFRSSNTMHIPSNELNLNIINKEVKA
jgi:hypothetical protein